MESREPRPEREGFIEGYYDLIVKEDTVYTFVVGGPPRSIGYVENGIAYQFVVGGPGRVLGEVRYRKEKTSDS